MNIFARSLVIHSLFDAVRTPRGRGKASGALHEVKPVTLVTQLLEALTERQSFPTSAVDDVVLGCVTPVGEQGANLAKTATLVACLLYTSPSPRD